MGMPLEEITTSNDPALMRAFNLLVSAVERLGKLTVAPPLALTHVAGIPCLSVNMPPAEPIMYGMTYDAIAAGASGPVKFYRGVTKGSETADATATTVYNRLEAFAVNKKVYVAKINGGWEIIGGEC